ncbi:hypothetical protein TD95_004477 [Thielaviopsis punctulata]|uniref:Sin3 binding protein n=1 Tax=Thielaviopsis punctulata TaxID=72032 RepID=A0A0F4ZMY1_9PEZI|nr:hypothetical protein TD95_004477 [Thielaviopsis punctulata]
MAHAGRDIPQASLNRDNFTAVAARNVPVTAATRSHLPSPPSSISPGLQPHGLKAQLLQHQLQQQLSQQHLHQGRYESVDSDLDLHEDCSRSSGSPIDPTSAISPAMLSQNYLPEILLNHGPLAIRHIMGYLTTSVPGFAAVPPTRARRLIVTALEYHGEAGANDTIIFEKVGWGRWSARRRGQPPASDRLPPAPNEHEGSMSMGIPIAGSSHYRRPKNNSSSTGGDSIIFSHDDRDISMMDHEADKMSLDGSGSASCSEAPDDDDEMDDEDDVTDDEDWAAVGAAALRAESYSNSFATRAGFMSSPAFSPASMRAFPSSFAAGMKMARVPQPQIQVQPPAQPQAAHADLQTLAATSNTQEREAVEALLSLGSL